MGELFSLSLTGDFGALTFVLTTHIDKGHIHNHLICAPIGGRVNPLSKRQA